MAVVSILAQVPCFMKINVDRPYTAYPDMGFLVADKKLCNTKKNF